MKEHKGTVLVVEDQRSVRQLAVNVLRQHGYRVLEAPDGSRAMEIASSEGAHLELLLTDVVLPGINGEELARILRAEHPDLRVIFMSGYEEDELTGRGIGGVGAAYITKPFTADVLTMMVAGAMGD
ncbi:MAG: response regulator [Longimicrobiales bacterium]